MINMDFDKALRDLFEPKSYDKIDLPPIPNLKEVQEIFHKKFGKGFIVNVNNDKCTVLFKFGFKELLSRFAQFKFN